MTDREPNRRQNIDRANTCKKSRDFKKEGGGKKRFRNN